MSVQITWHSADGRRTVGLMPKAKVEQVSDSGHSVYFQRAAIYNDLVERFLANIG